MKRMTENKAKELFAFVSNFIDTEKIPLDDSKTYSLLSKADTDGIYMLETDWDKYDLLQIQPSNFEELTACLALSHNPSINPYIYTYLKMLKVKLYTYPRFDEIKAVNEILKDTQGMLLYKEQADAINNVIKNMSNNEKSKHKIAIKIIIREIQQRKNTLSKRSFFQQRALLCYRIAYIKANFIDKYNCFISNKILS